MRDFEHPLTIAEFKRLLDIGLGRPILFLQKHDSAPYQDVILHACLYNMAFDRQLESSRAAYMMDVIKQTGQSTFYRNQILAALKNPSPEAEDYDIEQRLDFAGYFALQDDSEARELLYKYFGDTVNHSCASKIIEIDGIRGFLFVAGRLGELALADSDYFLWRIMEQVGEEAINLSLQQANDPRIAAYVQGALKLRAKREDHRNQTLDPTNLTYSQLKDMLNQGILSLTHLSSWGKQATASDLRLAAHDLQIESDPVKLRRYLAIFRKSNFPLDLDLLFSLAHHEDNWTARLTTRVLQNRSHPSVRAFALSMIEKFYQTGNMVALLINNYQDGDWQLIQELTHRDLERVDYHDLGWSILDFYDAHPSPEGTAVFLTLYDRCPCGICRLKFVKHLQSLDAVPVWMIEECRYDSYSELREMFGAGPAG